MLRDYIANAPHGIKVTKGSVHITACRGFVDYILHNSTAIEFREWIKTIPVPDELFFSSLNFNPQLGVPGSYKGKFNSFFILENSTVIYIHTVHIPKEETETGVFFSRGVV